LEALNISVVGKIALAKYGGPFRGKITGIFYVRGTKTKLEILGIKVKNAQAHGAIGVVIFTDTDGDGNVTAANGVATYPGTCPSSASSIQH
jgi:N-acetylated-alpha-linked acidic dipeptidase